VWSPDYEPDYKEYGDGTSDQVAIALALKKFQTQAETRNASSLQTMEVERIKTLVETKPQLKGLLPHVLVISVLPSVELATGSQPKGEVAKHNSADRTSKVFWKDLESVLLQVAVPKKTEYEFIQTQRCKVDKNGIPSVQKFKMMFESRACSSRILAASA